MILSASSLTRFQRCERLWNLEREWQVQRWRPKALFDSIVRSKVLELSVGKKLEHVVATAVADFMSFAASPGLDTTADPWILANDFAAMLKTVLEALSRLSLLTVKPGPTVSISPDVQWRCTAFQDDTGALHRWATVEKLDSDTLSRELHSWHVFGDMAAAQVPMTLHIIEIGRRNGSHQVTPWCRAWRHPAMVNVYRFQKTDGSKLGEGWQPWWFQDSERNDPKAWVDLMEKDGLNLIHHIPVKELAQEHVDAFREQISRLEMVARDPFTILMDRGSCDTPYPCPWQPVCYSTGRPDIESFGLYRKVLQ